MKAVNKVVGKALPLGYSNVDTDQIAPSDAMKFSKRTDFSEFLFRDWREDPNFILNRTEYQDSSMILAGENFGCGSSREHAPWALQDYGFKVIVAPSFGDIFKNNCSKVGLVTVELSFSVISELIEIVKNHPQVEITVDLENQTLSCDHIEIEFEIDDFTRYRLINGLDDIDLTLRDKELIQQYEDARPKYLPKVN
ncbi:3-isopropylmalate dehydratase small subunit [Halalkalibacter urbisdiaboli]|uniref:3-isopropylmalate dehydratase small subunit n=1 Tax=Halalkalibacter urbisdiaboli TaxID=1960589 RepID=UPI000B43D8A3|nr:3-isopropylmalate dehydratase small subunit [Halalkalibacter urbisdiaboli]